jgi:thiol-disulfide isomerase/thioredoxin
MTLSIRAKFAAAVVAAAALFAYAMPGIGGTSLKLAAASGSQAPNFVGIDKWFNSAPLSMAGLRGKVVLVDFWTYGCYNCVNTLPHVVKLHQKYADKGLVIVGVHTPEFGFEKSAANVARAIAQHGIKYAVAQDNSYATWKAYHNRYWPAQYIVDRSGNIVYTHAGEGAYAEMDQIIGKLLGAQS